jgi:DNA topoisomerase-1
MPKDLIIVESPAKVKTISKFLGKDYLVEASVGHVRDLPARDLGVDESADFAPQYEVIKGKEEVVKRLRRAAKQAGHVFLAPDPDREGEAIAWHVAALIEKENANVSRIQFNEITARAVKEALENPKPLDASLFDSQQARRVLDRLVGYKISPILWKTVKRGISAGRVQSVALKLVVEREKERRAFTPQEYWLFKALFAEKGAPPEAGFRAELWKVDGKPVKTTPIGSAEEAGRVEAAMKDQPFLVDEVAEKRRKRQAPPPYITSTLQQDANNRMGYSAKRTMSTAQRLYEGVELPGRGLTALITYMRTDSVRVAKEAQDAAREVILERFGKDFCPKKYNVYKTKGSAQDAHEAIRPVDPAITPDDVRSLPREQQRLYQLIWQRFMASQMTPAEFHDTTVTIACASTLWRAKGERLLFPGFLAAMEKAPDESPDLPKLGQGQELDALEVTKEQKFTQPPPRYSEAALVKELEEKGIGRPSTYASIISTLQDRDYVTLEEKRFAPTELGFVVSDQLSENFKELMDVGFTAAMEGQLDDVADGKLDWTALMRDFAQGFYPTLETARTNMNKAVTDTGVSCPECGAPMVVKFSKAGEFLGCSAYPKCKAILNFKRDEKGTIVPVERAAAEDPGIPCDKCGSPMHVKNGRLGEFLGCSAYPKCKNIKNFVRTDDGSIEIVAEPPQEVVGKCPECKHDLVIKRSRAGSRFIACTNYPDCKYTAPFSTGVPCPVQGCDGELVEKGSRSGKVFYSCSRYPKCDYALWNEPLNEPCPECGHPLLLKKNTRAKGAHIACPQRDCKYERPDEGATAGAAGKDDNNE